MTPVHGLNSWIDPCSLLIHEREDNFYSSEILTFFKVMCMDDIRVKSLCICHIVNYLKL